MEILVTEVSTIENSLYIELTSGKQGVDISFDLGLGTVRVLYKNSTHKAYRGMGRTFFSWEEAKAGYKSASLKAMIELAEETAAVTA